MSLEIDGRKYTLLQLPSTGNPQLPSAKKAKSPKPTPPKRTEPRKWDPNKAPEGGYITVRGFKAQIVESKTTQDGTTLVIHIPNDQKTAKEKAKPPKSE